VRASSAQVADQIEFDIGRERRENRWGDYVQGVTFALGRAGAAIRGFELRLDSTVPVGSGLSSSAALEVSLLKALRAAFALPLDDLQLAQLGHEAEVEFVGAPVGIMDQMACSLGREREALFIDTRTLQFERLPLPSSLDLVVLDSLVAHQHSTGGYAERRRESEQAAALLGVPRLRDLSLVDLAVLDGLPPVLGRRARHVITENARVLAARSALERQDLHSFGELLNRSHE
jgi:galactokinase